MDLLQALRPECCSVNLSAHDKDAVLRRLAELACKSTLIEPIGVERVYQHLKEREEQGSTGFGNGVALPHAGIEELEEFVVGVAISPRGVDFGSLDRKKTRIIVFILGPADARGDHLKTLAAVSRQVNAPRVREELLKAPTATALHESFARRLGGQEEKRDKPQAMKLIFVILYLEELLYEVLEFFLEQGIEGATILESAGMGQYISSVPLYAEFIAFMQERKNQSQTIIALIPSDREQQIVRGIEAITGDMDTTQGAMVMTMDVSFHKGTMKMM
ncbi:MAG: PTS sugar transporter subunit IIA [Spirochaetaceae bacterium]|nr:MAG: PTS sugar transporter subunit IIA [Spirochaetaceae bacterium]